MTSTEFDALVAEAEQDENVLGLILQGSRGKGFENEYIDGYINSTYRAIKAVQKNEQLGGHLAASNAMLDLLTLVFALEGRHRPFLDYTRKELEIYPLKELPWETGVFISKIERVLQSGDLGTQQKLLKDMEEVCRRKGYGHMFDGWNGKDTWAMTYLPRKI